MTELNNIEDTLFVPMLGRIYATENFPHILNDQKAVELKSLLPANIKGQNTQSQYTLMAGAIRSTNMDRYIATFLKKHPDGVVAQLGLGLETTYYRHEHHEDTWYGVDLEDVINYRRTLLKESEKDIYIIGDAFAHEWIQTIRREHPEAPILVTASGLFYYFDKAQVLSLFKNLKQYGDIEIVFDTVNKIGMSQMAKYMKQVGHSDAPMYFYVDSGLQLAKQVDATLLMEEPYYKHIDLKGLSFITRMTMKISDKFNMVKMVSLKLNA